MSKSQEIALRCSASLPQARVISCEERRHNRRIARQDYRTRFNLTQKQVAMLGYRQIERLEGCADDAARRLLLGVSH